MRGLRGRYSEFGLLGIGGVLVLVVLVLFLLVKRPLSSSQSGDVAKTGTARSQGRDLTPSPEDARRAAIASLQPMKIREGTNAADAYNRAMTLYALLTDEEREMLKSPVGKLDPTTAAALYAKIQPMMDLLRSARKADYTDWGIYSKYGENGALLVKGGLLISQSNTIDSLASVALWASGYRFGNDPDGAVGDLAAMEWMSRGGVDGLVGLGDEFNIHTRALHLLGENADKITAGAELDLAEILSTTTTEKLFQTTWNDESAVLQADLEQYADPAERADSTIQNQVNSGKQSQTVVAGMQWMMQTERTLGTALAEPDAQFQQWWAQQLALAGPTPYMANPRFYPQIRSRWEGLLVQNAMLEAAIALEQNDQAKYQSITDAATGQPFVYTRTATAVQLGAAAQNGQHVLVLNFPLPGSN